MANPVPNRRPPVYFNKKRVDAFLAPVSWSPAYRQEVSRYIQFWRQALNTVPRASLRDDRLPWRVHEILGPEKAQLAKLVVLRSFLAFLVVRGDLRPDEDHISGLELKFFRAVG